MNTTLLPMDGSMEGTAIFTFAIALVFLFFHLQTSGWFRVWQMRREITSLSGRLPPAQEANLEKVAELLSEESTSAAHSQGLLWNLIQTAETRLRMIRRHRFENP
ncbi:MAG TPA: hypothetical protein PLC15_16340 [Candidatus Obscuribacter sp.]|nr:hypothetical protein [Candidatus Obscuribacter sp.]MBK9280297.1 hypothetical protein [Candidatus Obscuribacter sp.]HMX45514.1 hypothetical protein [Candidatus Obscuribacter sp.]HMY02663.1 hypothetical protein [Candidatus Obscuribacter sp.]HMY55996.1 hypothetical protein [Candidatus Obscuribacter sp.]